MKEENQQNEDVQDSTQGSPLKGQLPNKFKVQNANGFNEKDENPQINERKFNYEGRRRLKLEESRKDPRENQSQSESVFSDIYTVKTQQPENPFAEQELRKMQDYGKKIIEKQEKKEKQNQIQKRQQINFISSEKQQIISFYEKLLQRGLSFGWMFINSNPKSQLEEAMKKLQNDLARDASSVDDSFRIPWCQDVDSAMDYFNFKNCVFNVVVDVKNAQQLIRRPEIQNQIRSIYLFLDDTSTKTQLKVAKIKQKSKKFRGFYKSENLKQLMDIAYIDMQNATQFEKTKTGQITLSKQRVSNLPNFIKLNDKEKLQVTNYRTCLIGAIKLTDPQERRKKRKEFINFADRTESKTKDYHEYLDYYQKIDHQSCNLDDEQKHTKILRLYSKPTFYHKLTNNLLRVCRDIDEFKLATIPFNENYHAIKYFYNKSYPLTEKEGRKIQDIKLFRGMTMKQMQFNKLMKGDFIEILGFVSTSTSLQVAQKFINGQDAYMLVITIKGGQIPKKYKDFDHGFVGMVKNHIPQQQQIKGEKEVLLNAFGVYKVTHKVQPNGNGKNGNIGEVHLEYGAIFDLLQKAQKDKNKMKEEQLNVLRNYNYFIMNTKEINDQIDVYINLQQYEKAKQLLEQKILSKKGTIEDQNRLTDIYITTGDLHNARLSAIRSKQMTELLNNSHPQRQSQLLSIMDKNISFFIDEQDLVQAKDSIEIQLRFIDQATQWLFKSQKLKKKAQIQLIEQRYIDSYNSFNKSEQILLNKLNSFEQRKSEIQFNYIFKHVVAFFTRQNVEEQKQNELNAVEQEKIKFEEEFLPKINELLFSINEGLMKLAKKQKNNKLFQERAAKCKFYLDKIDLTQINDSIEKVEKMMTRAKMQNALQDQDNIKQSYKDIVDVIETLERIDPLHVKLIDASQIKAQFIVKDLKKMLMLPQKKYITGESLPRAQMPEFDEQLCKKLQQDAVQSLEKALVVAAYHKGQQNPVVFEIRNQIAQVEFNRSKFQKSKKQLRKIVKTQKGQQHSQGARAHIQMARIYLATGQIYKAQSQIQKAHQILRKAFIKDEKNNILQYQQVLQLSSICMDAKLYECKIRNKKAVDKAQHVEVLTKIQELKKTAMKKLKNADGVGYLSVIYEEMGNTYLFKGDMGNFLKYFEKAIVSRKNQIGHKYCNNNAISLCTMAKNLIYNDDIQTACEYLSQAFEIFSKCPNNHPSFWVYFSTRGYYWERVNHKQSKQNELKEISKSVKLISKRYTNDHISLIKMRLRKANALIKNNQEDHGQKIYSQLVKQMELDQSVSRMMASNISNKEKGKKNEKVAIYAKVEESLRLTKLRKSKKISNSNLGQSFQYTTPVKDNLMTKNQLSQTKLLGDSVQEINLTNRISHQEIQMRMIEETDLDPEYGPKMEESHVKKLFLE